MSFCCSCVHEDWYLVTKMVVTNFRPLATTWYTHGHSFRWYDNGTRTAWSGTARAIQGVKCEQASAEGRHSPLLPGAGRGLCGWCSRLHPATNCLHRAAQDAARAKLVASFGSEDLADDCSTQGRTPVLQSPQETHAWSALWNTHRRCRACLKCRRQAFPHHHPSL